MRHDALLTIALSVALAAWATTHVSLCIAISRKMRVATALLSLLLAPAAPYFGLRGGFRVRSMLWILFGIVYALLRQRAYA